MLKFWLRAKTKQPDSEIDAYSQLLAQVDPYYESFRLDLPRDLEGNILTETTEDTTEKK